MPNFVEIARTVAEICKFLYYASLAWKCLFTLLLGFFSGTFPRKWCHSLSWPQKDYSWTEPRHLSHKPRKSVARFELCVGARKKGQGRTGSKSQKGYISRICGEASTDLVGDVLHVITCTKFQNKIFSGYDFTGGRIFHFPIDFWMGLTTVQRYCAACVKELTYHKIQGVLISHIIYILGRDKSNLAILVSTE